MDKNIPIYDAHFHIIDNQYPLNANHGFVPDPFTIEQYRSRLSGYDLLGGTLVAGSFQSDYQFMERALKTLGQGYVGIVQASPTMTDEQIVWLSNIGVRGIRFNIQREGKAGLEYLPRLAAKVYEIARWHVELYIDSRDMAELVDIIALLPSATIDHLGLSEVGFKHITKLIERNVYIKATGFGRLDFNAKAAIINLYSINPQRLIFGSDLPSTRSPIAYSDHDYELMVDTLGEKKAKDVLYHNALELYQISLDRIQPAPKQTPRNLMFEQKAFHKPRRKNKPLKRFR